jgi:LysM repeat protein
MQIMTVDGEAILEPDTPNEVVVPEGYTTQRCVGEPQDLGIDGEANDREVFDDCQWLYPVLLTPEEQQLGQFLFNTHNGLNQPAFVPTVTPFVPTVPPVPTCVTGQSITHTVVAGETLFNIALRYNTTINAIMVANRLTNSNSIFAGQQLVVNCGDQSNPPLPTEEVPPGAVDCSNFFPVFEDTVPYGDATFSWNPAPGATRYEVYFYVRDSQPIDAGTNTSVTIDVTSTAFSGEFAWTVTAYYNSRAVCGTQLVYVTREPGPDETAEPTETVVPPGSVDCATFRITSPLGGMAYGRETFYWDAAPGATSYTLVIAGETATTGFNAGTDTSITIDTTEGSIGFGLQFTWSVAALLDGRVACQSNAITIYRESAPSITPDPLPEITPDPSPEVTVSPSSSQEIDCINRGGVWIDDGYGNFFCDTYSRVD